VHIFGYPAEMTTFERLARILHNRQAVPRAGYGLARP
jgi:hypothetical protein